MEETLSEKHQIKQEVVASTASIFVWIRGRKKKLQLGVKNLFLAKYFFIYIRGGQINKSYMVHKKHFFINGRNYTFVVKLEHECNVQVETLVFIGEFFIVFIVENV